MVEELDGFAFGLAVAAGRVAACDPDTLLSPTPNVTLPFTNPLLAYKTSVFGDGSTRLRS